VEGRATAGEPASLAEREAALVADLTRPENLPPPEPLAPEAEAAAAAGAGALPAVELLTTHGSLVFRTPQRTYKLKRAKDYGFFDYTTLAQRARFCAEEVRLNRRAAPDVYLGVLPVWHDRHGYSLVRAGAEGAEADWAVCMRTLPDAASALSRVRAGTLGTAALSAVAERIARFHREADEAPPAEDELERIVAENFEQSLPFAPALLDAGVLRELRALQERWLRRAAPLLARRAARDGHGDLRLEHVYLLPGGPVLIDCLEFSARYRVADPALDVAFLAMDLRREGRPDLSEFLLARWAFEADDHEAFALIDGAMSVRAHVRAKVACLVATDRATPAARAARKAGEAAAFLRLALALLAEPPRAPLAVSGRPLLMGIGGVIASGKSTLADALTAALGVPVVSADAVRKSLAGLRHAERGGSALYAPNVTARVHDELLARAGHVLGSGRPVLLDTTFSARALRDRVRALAAARGAAFLLLEVRVPEEVVRARLRARSASGGLSDAREEHATDLLAAFEPFTDLAPEEHLLLDGTRPADELVSEVRARLARL
jgi:uncharacterized protein